MTMALVCMTERNLLCSGRRHAWCHPELVSGSGRRGSSSTADSDLHQDDTVDDDQCLPNQLAFPQIIYVLLLI